MREPVKGWTEIEFDRNNSISCGHKKSITISSICLYQLKISSNRSNQKKNWVHDKMNELQFSLSKQDNQLIVALKQFSSKLFIGRMKRRDIQNNDWMSFLTCIFYRRLSNILYSHFCWLLILTVKQRKTTELMLSNDDRYVINFCLRNFQMVFFPKMNEIQKNVNKAFESANENFNKLFCIII